MLAAFETDLCFPFGIHGQLFVLVWPKQNMLQASEESHIIIVFEGWDKWETI